MRTPAVVLLTSLVLLAGPAGAHGTLPGGGGFYAGASHPFLAWEHLLTLAGLGMLIGRHGRSARRLPVLVLAGGLSAGLVLGTQALVWANLPIVILALGLALGLLLAAALTVPKVVLGFVALATSIAVGADTGVPAPTAPDLVARLAPYLGVVAGVFLIVLNGMALGATATRPPLSIAVRVAGSWIAAAAMLILALHVRRLGGGG